MRPLPAAALLLLLLLLALALALATATARADELRDLPYVGHGDPLQKLDLHLPGGDHSGPRPVVIGIHGGGWSIGDKSNASFVHPKSEWFNDHGFIFASVNYRLSPQVRHPAHLEDVCAAIAWIQDHIAEHGGDPQRLYLLGHSAGAHLAALAAVDQDRLKAAGVDPAGIRGVILIDGAGYDVARQANSELALKRVETMYRDAFTSDPEVQRDASPVFKVSTRPPPFLILHVARRADSRLQSRLLAEALQAKGGTTTVTAIRGKSHLTINRDFGKAGDPTTVAAAAFLGLGKKED